MIINLNKILLKNNKKFYINFIVYLLEKYF